MLHLVSLSGGLDSATLLAHVLAEAADAATIDVDLDDKVEVVSFRYPSKHNPAELEAAGLVAAYYNVPHHIVDCSGVFAPLRKADSSRSALLIDGPQLPRGHYTAESMRQTVIPGRNLIFAAAAAAIVQNYGNGVVYLGVHAGDHAIYPDCRRPFIDHLRDAVSLASEGRVTMRAPYITMTKDQIVKRGLSLHVPYLITRTCYSAGAVACGACGSCQERLEAFHLNGMPDPLPYTTRELLAK